MWPPWRKGWAPLLYGIKWTMSNIYNQTKKKKKISVKWCKSKKSCYIGEQFWKLAQSSVLWGVLYGVNSKVKNPKYKHLCSDTEQSIVAEINSYWVCQAGNRCSSTIHEKFQFHGIIGPHYCMTNFAWICLKKISFIVASCHCKVYFLVEMIAYSPI